MANSESDLSCHIKHMLIFKCRRADLGIKLNDVLSQGGESKCLETKIKLVDGLLDVMCTFVPEDEYNCLTDEEMNEIITYLYMLLPEEC